MSFCLRCNYVLLIYAKYHVSGGNISTNMKRRLFWRKKQFNFVSAWSKFYIIFLVNMACLCTAILSKCCALFLYSNSMQECSISYQEKNIGLRFKLCIGYWISNNCAIPSSRFLFSFLSVHGILQLEHFFERDERNFSEENTNYLYFIAG